MPEVQHMWCGGVSGTSACWRIPSFLWRLLWQLHVMCSAQFVSPKQAAHVMSLSQHWHRVVVGNKVALSSGARQACMMSPSSMRQHTCFLASRYAPSFMSCALPSGIAAGVLLCFSAELSAPHVLHSTTWGSCGISQHKSCLQDWGGC